MGSVVAEIDRRIATEIDLPAGYSLVFGGQFENQQRAQHRLMIVVPLALGLIFLLLYFAFHSVGQALLIMLNVPLALIGGVAALYVSGLYLSVPSSIGFIAVFGTAVLNGVVMVNAINQNLEGGKGQRQAILDGALAGIMEEKQLPGVTVDANYQLAVEDAAQVAEYDVVVFADAAIAGDGPFWMKRILPGGSAGG